MHKHKKVYKDACKIVEILKSNGFSAYFAGGAVRDMQMNRPLADDIDIATSATPDIVLSLFPVCHEIGAAFGIINVVMDSTSFEVATFREERGYNDGRHPDKINYTDSPELDAERRDFTINSMFYDPLENKLLDFKNGRKDIEKRIIRTVGDADKRLAEDYLRILRAVRFAVRFDFRLDPALQNGIKRNLDGLSGISKERIRDELNKMFTGPSPEKALKMLASLGILDVILPELSTLQGVQQPVEYHPEGDVFVHTALMLEKMTDPDVELAWAVLLHDIGKPAAFSIGNDGTEHFYKHDKIGAEIAENILRRLKFPKKQIENIVRCVGNHMRFAHVKEMRKAKLKRLIAEPSFPLQLELHKLDCTASHGKLDNYEMLCRQLENNETEMTLPEPLINGKDLIKLGFKPGKAMGELLKQLMDLQLEGKIKSKQDAIDYLHSL